MDNLGSKFQKGFSNVQKGIEDGKNKIQTSQEVLALKEEVRVFEEKRSSIIIDLGELTYKRIRENQIKEEALNNIALEILGLDKEIFSLLQIIEEKSKKEKDLQCECGSELTASDRFCKECGKKVELAVKKQSLHMVICERCQTENTAENNYCNCCGLKINQVS